LFLIKGDLSPIHIAPAILRVAIEKASQNVVLKQGLVNNIPHIGFVYLLVEDVMGIYDHYRTQLAKTWTPGGLKLDAFCKLSTVQLLLKGLVDLFCAQGATSSIHTYVDYKLSGAWIEDERLTISLQLPD
jgi:hypothetical protein